MRRGILAVLGALVWATACDAPTAPDDVLADAALLALGAGANAVSVLTRNIYLGADIAPITQLPSSEVPFAVAARWEDVHATVFETRAQALADEVAATEPHLIGLQEVSTWRTQSPGDYVLGQRAPNATTIAYDYLALFLAALEERGLDYQVAALSPTSDVEMPAYTGVGSPPFMDIRWSDAVVVLVRADVEVLQSFAVRYVAGGAAQKAGLAAVRVRVGRRELTFVTTHLMHGDVQAQQAAELLDWIGGQPDPIILVGDFNTAANPGAPAEEHTATYGMLLGAGFTDVWDRGNKPESGLTCCHDELLVNESVALHTRKDLILLNQGLGRMVGAVQARVVGDDPAVRADYGLWPSDHAGVFATIHLPMR